MRPPLSAPVQDVGSSPATRGHGMLENFLSRQRAALTNKLIPPALRDGALLDIGCGSKPLFLTHTQFPRKYGLDKMLSPQVIAHYQQQDIQLVNFDFQKGSRLPFVDDFFSVVTMLAVFEHIPHQHLLPLINEAHRVLKPSGVYILTTPASWTGPILDAMKHLGLVSREEIDEHQDAYSRKLIRHTLRMSDFGSSDALYGSFEMGMNLYARVAKPQTTTGALRIAA